MLDRSFRNLPVHLTIIDCITNKEYIVNGYLTQTKKFVIFYNPIIKKTIKAYWSYVCDGLRKTYSFKDGKLLSRTLQYHLERATNFIVTSKETEGVGTGMEAAKRYYEYKFNPSKYPYRYSHLDNKLRNLKRTKHMDSLNFN